MATVEIYVTPNCPFCVAAKALFDRKGVAYRTIDVSEDADKRRWLVELTGQRTVPQIFIAGSPYGGYSDILPLDADGRLDKLLAS